MGTILWFKQNSNATSYFSLTLSKNLWFCSLVFLSTTEEIVGTTVSATINDAISAYEIVNAKGIINWLTVPDV